MDINLYKIIQTLIENGPTTNDELAYLEDVSGRTIENRVKELRSILKKQRALTNMAILIVWPFIIMIGFLKYKQNF